MINVGDVSKLYKVFNPSIPYLIFVKHGDKINAMTATWVTPLSFDPMLVGVLISPKRYTFELISKSKDFAIVVPTKEQKDLVVFFGTRSGKDVDKTERMEDLIEPMKISTPYIKGGACVECEKVKMERYGDHYLVVGKVMAGRIDPTIFDKNGCYVKNAEKLIAYGGLYYFSFGEKV